MNYSIATSLEKEKDVGIYCIRTCFIKSEAAPLRNALIKAGLGSDVISSFDNGILQPMFSIIVNGSEANKVDEFTKVVTDTLNDIVKMALMMNYYRLLLIVWNLSFVRLILVNIQKD